MVKVVMAPIKATIINVYYIDDPHAKKQVKSSPLRDAEHPKLGSHKNTDIAILYTPRYCEFLIIYLNVLISYQI